VIARVVSYSSRHPWLVLGVALLLAIAGELGRERLARDAVPDLSDPQIGIVVDWMGHPAAEVASSVTSPLTSALEHLPRVTAVRGSSMSGMAYVDVVFSSASDLGPGREAILERIREVRHGLPNNARLEIGPEASSTGWVFQYALFDPSRAQTPSKLRRFQDDILRPALSVIPGVAEIASVGGADEQVLVEVRRDDLSAKGLAFSDVISTLRPALQGGARSVSQLAALRMPVPYPGGEPPPISAVARVRVADDVPTGLADYGGTPAVGGIVIARRNADLSSLVDAVRRTLIRERARLSPSVRLICTYDRMALARHIEDTLVRALTEEIAAVVLVVLLFLLHGRSALVPLLTLPLVVLLTFLGMWMLRVPATMMSLGGIGIALGMAVDADVVALDACHRSLETIRRTRSDAARRAAILQAAGTIAPAILTSLVITALSFLPVFAFSGESGRLLRPLALTKTLVIAAATLVTLTVAPALRAHVLGGRVTAEFENPLTRGLVGLYRPFVHFALSRPFFTLTTAALAVCSCLPLLPKLGGEFFPRVDEGDLLFMPTTLPGISEGDAATQLARQDRVIAGFPEVLTAFGKVGRAQTASDPAPLSMAETTIRLRPRSQWPKLRRERWYSRRAPPTLRDFLRSEWPEEAPMTTAELVDKLNAATHLPGWTNAWTAPARARMDMMATGVRTPVGIRIVSSDPSRLDDLGRAVQSAVLRLPGTRSAVFEALSSEMSLEFEPDVAALARHRVDSGLLRSTAELLLKGAQPGELQLAGSRLPVRVTLEPDPEMSGPMEHGMQGAMGRLGPDQLRDVTVRAGPGASGQPIPFGLLGRPTFVPRQAEVRTESGHPVAYVHVDLNDGSDLTGYVRRAKEQLAAAVSAKELRLQADERIEFTGQYDLLIAAQRRLAWIVPIVGASMLGLLFLQFRNAIESLLVALSVPFALVGSIWTIFLLGYPLSAPVWIGLLSVVGLAMQTGVVMVVYIDEAFYRRLREGTLRGKGDVIAAHAEGTVKRLRPKVMTVATMGAGLLPLLWADGAGAEIMKRVAAPMIGGLATSAFLTLEVLPVIYTTWRVSQLRRAERMGLSIEAVVGAAPSWARQ
jgi:copper/silver efflux system protein